MVVSTLLAVLWYTAKGGVNHLQKPQYSVKKTIKIADKPVHKLGKRDSDESSLGRDILL